MITIRRIVATTLRLSSSRFRQQWGVQKMRLDTLLQFRYIHTHYLHVSEAFILHKPLPDEILSNIDAGGFLNRSSYPRLYNTTRIKHNFQSPSPSPSLPDIDRPLRKLRHHRGQTLRLDLLRPKHALPSVYRSACATLRLSATAGISGTCGISCAIGALAQPYRVGDELLRVDFLQGRGNR